MKPEEALARGKTYLDEATENITFDEHLWALEEAWRGLAWVLNAVCEASASELELGPKGRVPQGDVLAGLVGEAPELGGAGALVARMVSLRERLFAAEDVEGAVGRSAGAIDEIVFGAWEVHDACGEYIGVEDERLGDKLLLAEASPGTIGSPRVGRRAALKLMALAGAAPLAACRKVERDNRSGADEKPESSERSEAASSGAEVESVRPIDGMHWETSDPFLFCAHHFDEYPAGDEELGPATSLAGRHLGRDFDESQDWRMYHGKTVPGFPRHPHRGFETVTVVRTGMLDHSDSMGATARYGGGDVQWLTAGGGIQHAEMFPLLDADSDNPLELFQIWLNLPRADKMVDPYFTMLWHEEIPRVTERDDEGRASELTVAAGSYGDHRPPSPPPNSWASREESDLAIWTLRMEPRAQFELPAVSEGTRRSLYVHRGAGLTVADTEVANRHRVTVGDDGPLRLENGPAETEILYLQARPIGEPVAKRGPFVMNTQEEIREAYADYRKTDFGGWPWNDQGPVHDRPKGRFARHIDGSFDEPG